MAARLKPKKRVAVDTRLNPDTVRMIDRLRERLGHSRAAMVRYITDEWAKTARKARR